MKITKKRLMELAGLPINESITKAQMIKGIGLPIEDDGVLLDVLARAKVLGMKQGPSSRAGKQGTLQPGDPGYDQSTRGDAYRKLTAMLKAKDGTPGQEPSQNGINDFYFNYDDPSGAKIYTGKEDVSPSVLYILNPKMQNDSEIKRLVNDLDQMLSDESGE